MRLFARDRPDRRSPERVRHHYVIERELADRLRGASRAERATLYATVYDELFRRVPDHPQLADEPSAHERHRDDQLPLLRPLVGPESTFLELGAGDGDVSRALAPHVRRAIAVDVSEEILPRGERPPNMELLVTDGQRIPVEPGSVDVVYSNQVMEHLHPEDALAQLREVAKVLAPGGRYVCITPHRYSGPHDVSRGFDDEATGLHLKEYTTSELVSLFAGAGFSPIRALVTFRGRQAAIPTAIARALEVLLARFPPRARRIAAQSPLRKLLVISLVATKPPAHRT